MGVGGYMCPVFVCLLECSDLRLICKKKKKKKKKKEEKKSETRVFISSSNIESLLLLSKQYSVS